MKKKRKQELTAIIYDKRGMPLSIGRNSYFKTHTYQAKIAKQVGLPEKEFVHAEIDAILKLKHPEKAHRILVTRFGANGQELNAKPCPVCAKAIELAKITIIEHT